MDTSVKSAFDRINTEFARGTGTKSPVGPTRSPGSPQGAPQAPPAGRWAGSGGVGWTGGAGGGRGGGWGGGAGGGWGGAGMAPAATGTRPFSSARTYDKLVILCIIAIASAAVGYVAVPIGAAFACMIGAFVLVIVSWFRMRWARVIAPTYSVLEGVALGAISAQFASFGHGIVPTAVVFTAGVFLAALALYRTGLVRVTPRMVSLAVMGGFGIVAVGVLSLLGLSLPGVSSFGTAGLLFGVFALGVAVLNLFADFEYVNRSEQLGVSADGEWAAAFAMMTALVLVYISILRILAAAYGGGRRR